jgi:macrophage erythroblast attacher
MIEAEVFAAARKVVDGLRKRSCAEGLQWCQENRVRLKKIQSNLEFRLRVQEYVQFVKAGKVVDAIAYARKFLSPFAATNMKELQQAIAALAYIKHTQRGIVYAQYQKLFDEERWEELISEFRREHCALNGLTTDPTLSIVLQVGLSALKTPSCGVPEERTTDCPVCVPPLSSLSQAVPSGHYKHSSLICRITGETMDADNCPMALPNGNVYSHKALREMAERSGGEVTDPATGERYTLRQCRKAFIFS